MANRKKSESISFYIKTQVELGKTREEITEDFIKRVESGEYKTKLNPVGVVRWYMNYHIKKAEKQKNTNVEDTKVF